jgi:hypothetical protein
LLANFELILDILDTAGVTTVLDVDTDLRRESIGELLAATFTDEVEGVIALDIYFVVSLLAITFCVVLLIVVGIEYLEVVAEATAALVVAVGSLNGSGLEFFARSASEKLPTFVIFETPAPL